MKGHVRKRCHCSQEARKRCRHSWAYVVEIGRNGSTGKRQQKWVSGFKTRAAAEKSMRDSLSELDDGRDPFPKKLTVREFMNQWLDHWKGQVRPKTFAGYETLIQRHVLPV